MSYLLKASDVKEKLGVGLATVYNLAHSGALQAVEIRRGKRKTFLRFRPEAVECFIKERETKNGR